MKYLYIPVEIWSREFDAKILLTTFAVNQGWTVVIGPKTSMERRLEKFPNGIVLQYGLSKHFKNSVSKLKNFDHKIAVLDEESLVTLGKYRYLKDKITLDTAQYVDYFFCCGPKHFNIVNSKLKKIKNCSLAITGNPRLDLLRKNMNFLFEDESEKIKKIYGNFILVNGNFGSFNHAMGEKYTQNALKEKGWINSYDDLNFHNERIALQGYFFKKFQEMILDLSRNGWKIIVRPHPSENLAPWMVLSKKAGKRVKVIRQGNIIPWLIASNAIIHNGCTTAIEAFMLGKPVISYRPKIIERLETVLPNKISIQVSNLKDLIKTLSSLDKYNTETYKKRKKYLCTHINQSESFFSCQKILSTIKPNKIKNNSRKIYSYIEIFKVYIKEFFSLLSANKHSQLYANQKSHALSRSEVLELCTKISNNLNLKFNFKVKNAGNGLIVVYPNAN